MEAGDIVSLLIGLFAVAYVILNVLAELARSKKRQEQGREQEEEYFEEQQVKASQVKTSKETPPSPPPLLLPKEPKKTPLRSMQGAADEKFEFRSKLESFRQKTNIDERSLPIHLRQAEEIVSEDLRIQQSEGSLYKTKKISPLEKQISLLPSRSLIMISHELLRAPVAFRSSIFPRDI